VFRVASDLETSIPLENSIADQLDGADDPFGLPGSKHHDTAVSEPKLTRSGASIWSAQALNRSLSEGAARGFAVVTGGNKSLSEDFAAAPLSAGLLAAGEVDFFLKIPKRVPGATFQANASLDGRDASAPPPAR
jgi:hypothetical protein